MCGENPENRMEELIMNFDASGHFMTDDGRDFAECSAEQVAKVLGTTPQVAGKVMRCFDDLWKRKIKRVGGRQKVVYVPIPYEE